MKRLSTMVALAVVISVGAAFAAPSARAARPGQGSLTDPSVPIDSSNLGELTASVTITAVDVVNQTVSGTITTVEGGTQTFTAVVTDIQQGPNECQILDLVLGPLNLDILGLVVFLDTVHLNITAVQGPGNLLGNLLCALAGLLDP